MARIHKPSFSNGRNKKNNTQNVDGVINWVQSVIRFFESKKEVDLQTLRYALTPFSTRGYWLTLKRSLFTEGHISLFQKINTHRAQIDSIVSGFGVPANNNIYDVPLLMGNVKESKVFTGSEGPDDVDWEGDIRILFERHFPGTRGELLPSDIAGFKNILMGEARTRHEYEMRLAEYMANSNLFIKDFCPWMSTTNIG